MRKNIKIPRKTKPFLKNVLGIGGLWGVGHIITKEFRSLALEFCNAPVPSNIKLRRGSVLGFLAR
eukprot:5360504-Amphidinium_carterae.1